MAMSSHAQTEAEVTVRVKLLTQNYAHVYTEPGEYDPHSDTYIYLAEEEDDYDDSDEEPAQETESSVDYLKQQSYNIEGEIDTYVIHPNLVFEDEELDIKRYEILPRRRHVARHEKVIMLVGATGAGKSTLINGIVNYFLGVKWEDDYRFKLVEESEKSQAFSQTKAISAYTFNCQDDFDFPYTLTLVDTPGFGDTTEAILDKDRETVSQICEFFNSNGIDKIDAVGFVVQSSLARLTVTQQYIFDQVLSLFGKDVEDNIIMLLTFADGQKPKALHAIKEANVPYTKYYKFNHCALYSSNLQNDSDNEEEDEDEDDSYSSNETSWKMCAKSFKFFMKTIGSIESKSLTLTGEVLQERNNLETYIEGLRFDIQCATNKLEILAKETSVLKKHKEDVKRNKNFKFTVKQENITTHELKKGKSVTNCTLCHVTCHYPCAISINTHKGKCSTFGKHGFCIRCPKKCHWKKHRNMDFRYYITYSKVTKTILDIKKRYEDALGKKITAETLIKEVEAEFTEVQERLLSICFRVREALERLDEIALVSNPLSVVDYIDTLIDNEECSKAGGRRKRIAQLQELRTVAITLRDIKDYNYDPLQEVSENVAENNEGSLKAEDLKPWVNNQEAEEAMKQELESTLEDFGISGEHVSDLDGMSP